MFQPDPNINYLSPAHFGVGHSSRTTLEYRNVTTISAAYVTSAAKIESLLPECYQLRQPIITVYYQANREVEWLAGGGYNLLGVDVPVRFQGNVDTADGSLCLVLWENDTDAIISGRDLLGVPKVYADIENHHRIDNRWSTVGSKRNATFVELKLGDAVELSESELFDLNEQNRESRWFGYRFLSKVGDTGAALAEPTSIPTGSRSMRAWRGKPVVNWIPTTWERNPTQYHIVNTLCEMPIEEYLWGIASEGESTLSDETKAPMKVLE